MPRTWQKPGTVFKIFQHQYDVVTHQSQQTPEVNTSRSIPQHIGQMIRADENSSNVWIFFFCCTFIHIEFVEPELIFIGHYYHSIQALLIELYNYIYILFINLLFILEDYRKPSPMSLEMREIRSPFDIWTKK